MTFHNFHSIIELFILSCKVTSHCTCSKPKHNVYSVHDTMECMYYLWCRMCFVRLKLLLIAISEPAADGQLTGRVILNPSTRQRALINSETKGFFMCQSDDEAKRALYYCNNCHAHLDDPSKITQCVCSSTNKGLQSAGHTDVLYCRSVQHGHAAANCHPLPPW